MDHFADMSDTIDGEDECYMFIDSVFRQDSLTATGISDRDLRFMGTFKVRLYVDGHPFGHFLIEPSSYR